jgi:hypothetical protein
MRRRGGDRRGGVGQTADRVEEAAIIVSLAEVGARLAEQRI